MKFSNLYNNGIQRLKFEAYDLKFDFKNGYSSKENRNNHIEYDRNELPKEKETKQNERHTNTIVNRTHIETNQQKQKLHKPEN